MNTMKPYHDYLDPSTTIGKRPIVWKYTVLIGGEKHWFNRVRDVPAQHAKSISFEADPVAQTEAEAWDQLERLHMETAHETWKNDLFAQYSSLLPRAQFDRVYEILEECAPGDERLTHDEIAEHFEELYGFLFG